MADFSSLFDLAKLIPDTAEIIAFAALIVSGSTYFHTTKRNNDLDAKIAHNVKSEKASLMRQKLFDLEKCLVDHGVDSCEIRREVGFIIEEIADIARFMEIDNPYNLSLRLRTSVTDDRKNQEESSNALQYIREDIVRYFFDTP